MATITGIQTFNVPAGYVFVARSCTLTPNKILMDANGFVIVPIVSFSVNQIAVQQMSNLSIDLSVNTPIPCFFIAPQYAVVNITVIYDIGAMTPTSVLMTANLQGNFLLTNQPANLAVTNATSRVTPDIDNKLSR